MTDFPRVTAIMADLGLTIYDDVPAAILDAARERGTRVHAAVHDDVYRCLDESALSDAVLQRLAGWRKFVQDTGYQPIVAEAHVVSRQWRYQGHPDGIGWFGPRTLIDLKCVATVDLDAVTWQLAAYGGAWKEERPTEPIAKYVALQLLPEDYRIHDVTQAIPQAVNEFRAFTVTWWARQRRQA